MLFYYLIWIVWEVGRAIVILFGVKNDYILMAEGLVILFWHYLITELRL